MQAAAQHPEKREMKEYELCLYISGMSEKSVHAITNLNAICTKHLAGRYNLEIIDIYKESVLAEQEQIIACPSLIKKRPLPRKIMVGDMSNKSKVLYALGLDKIEES